MVYKTQTSLDGFSYDWQRIPHFHPPCEQANILAYIGYDIMLWDESDDPSKSW